MTGYVIRGGDDGYQRLLALGELHREGTLALLRACGVGAGMRCLDVGCGAGSVAFDLAELVGDTGHVVGVDLDEVKLGHAREAAAERGLANVEFRHGDVTSLDDEGGFDLVYARFLLQHVPDPEAVLRRMWAAVGPGGVVLVEDTDFAGHRCHPPSPAFDFYVDTYTAAVARRGGDAMIGRRLPELLWQVGAVDVQTAGRVYAGMDPGHKRIALWTLEISADAIVAEGLATPAQVSAAVEGLRRHLDDPGTMVIGPDILSAWARRPATDH